MASLIVEGNCSKLGKAANGFDEIDEIAAIDQTVALQIWENAKTRGRGRPARERVRVQLRGVGLPVGVRFFIVFFRSGVGVCRGREVRSSGAFW